MEKELTREELALEQLVPALTGTTDPLDGQIKDSEKTANATKNMLDNANLQLEALGTMDEPKTPEMYTKGTAQVTFGITAAAVVLLFLFHCIMKTSTREVELCNTQEMLLQIF